MVDEAGEAGSAVRTAVWSVVGSWLRASPIRWVVLFGIIGARLYHVITDPEFYFGAGRDPIRALYIWDGGLVIGVRSPWVRWVRESGGVGGGSGWLISPTRWTGWTGRLVL